MSAMNVKPGPIGNPTPLIELEMMNGAQGWFSGYLSREEAAQLLPVLSAFVERGEQPSGCIALRKR